jgi:hypothetical protein
VETLSASDGPLLARRLSAAAIVLLLVVAHGLEWRMRYRLYPKRPAGAFVANPLVHGSYGAYLARCPPRPAGSRTVVLLGNSVYQSYGIAEKMQALANREGANVCFVNFAQTGSSIFDYLVQFAHVISLKPDLVVLSFINNAFTDLRADGGHQPRFRTDADQMVFDWEVVKRLPFSFYAREFTLDELCTSLVSTLLPIRRVEVIRRADLFKDFAREKPAWIDQLVPVPGLNLVGDWSRANPGLANGDPVRAYPQLPQLLVELAQMVKKAGVPLLLLRQEAGEWDARPDVLPQLTELARESSLINVRDLHQLQPDERLEDGVHPDKSHSLAYATRHYREIVSILHQVAVD